MNDKDVDVIVVDDIPGAAEDYAKLIRAETGFKVSAFEDPGLALDIVRTVRVRVAVLDQRLDGKIPDAGTDLYRQIREIDPAVRAIMLTGEAESAEVGAALSLGFKKYIEKTQLQSLGREVLAEYATYQAEAAADLLSRQRPVVLVRRRGLFPTSKAVYRLIDLKVLDEAFVDSSEWTTQVELHSGQRRTVQRTYQIQSSVILERESTAKLTQELGLSTKKIANLSTKISGELSERVKNSHSKTVTAGASSDATYELPAEPADPNVVHIAYRRIQHAPVYERVRVSLACACDCCGLRNLITLDVRVSTDRRATRREDRLSDGSTRTYDLGVE